MEWPRNSGRRITFPEVDRAEWFALSEARRRILDGQRPLLDRLEEHLGGSGGDGTPGS
jgi:predicted NUDIX family NTP pyrophosphohydrolase